MCCFATQSSQITCPAVWMHTEQIWVSGYLQTKNCMAAWVYPVAATSPAVIPEVSNALLQDMTYVQQLRNYEDEVMQKRLEEMPQSERDRLMEEVEQDRERRKQRAQQQR